MCSRTQLDLDLAIASHRFIFLAIERNRNRDAEDLYISVGLKIPMQARSAEPKVLYMGILHKCCDSFVVHGLLDTDTVRSTSWVTANRENENVITEIIQIE